MPIKTFSTPAQAWQALTDEEIADDSSEINAAIITVPNLCKVKIVMLSEWDYYRVFIPLRATFINHYANKLAAEENAKDSSVLIEKVKAFQNEISKIRETNNPEVLNYLFGEAAARFELFKGLKKLGMVPFWISWKAWQKHVRPTDTMAIFCWLWLFNVDGLKKKSKLLIDRISQVMNTQSPTGSKIFQDLDSFKSAHAKAHARWLANSNN